jgi:uncharacterized integral membrane protein
VSGMETAHPHTHAKGASRDNGTSRSLKGPGRKRAVALGVVTLVAIWLIAFIISNAETVRVSFVFGHLTLSLVWVMIICAALGALIAWAVPRFSRR